MSKLRLEQERQASAREQRGQATLSELGARIRAWRARRGMTRRALSDDSGMSLRFLAAVEAGTGNLSVNSLQAIATALNIECGDLLQDPPRPAMASVQELLSALDETALEKAHEMLASAFHAHEVPGRDRRVALIGLRGAGKSTLGAHLARARGLPFIELDREIEREAGTSISEILLLHGQAGYRRNELRALLRVVAAHRDGLVITTGGSIVSERETFEALQRHCYCVWLKAAPEEHIARVMSQGDLRPFEGTQGDPADAVNRGAARALQDIRKILASREALYARADAVVDTSARTLKQSMSDLQRAVPRVS